MSDFKAAKAEILKDLDRVLINMDGVSNKQWTREKRDEVIWIMKLLRVARKSINETLGNE